MPNNLTVRAVRGVGVEVPTAYVLGTSRGAFTKANLVLVDLETDAGITGRSYIFGHSVEVSRAIVAMLAAVDRIARGCRRAARPLCEAARALRAHRSTGHHPHGACEL